MSIESMMPSNHLILCCPLLLLIGNPQIQPRRGVLSSPSFYRWGKSLERWSAPPRDAQLGFETRPINSKAQGLCTKVPEMDNGPHGPPYFIDEKTETQATEVQIVRIQSCVPSAVQLCSSLIPWKGNRQNSMCFFFSFNFQKLPKLLEQSWFSSHVGYFWLDQWVSAK